MWKQQKHNMRHFTEGIKGSILSSLQYSFLYWVCVGKTLQQGGKFTILHFVLGFITFITIDLHTRTTINKATHTHVQVMEVCHESD